MKRVGRPIFIGSKSGAAKTESQAMEEWGEEASQLIKREMRARDWGYAELAKALRSQGVKRSAAVINRRINRGNFSAGFLLACLSVLEYGEGVTTGKKATTGAAKVSTATQE